MVKSTRSGVRSCIRYLAVAWMKKHMLFENSPSKTHCKIDISKFILRAVVKKSDTTTVIYSVFENRPSKTNGKTHISKFLLRAVVQKSDTTTVIYCVFENRPSKTHSKITLWSHNIMKIILYLIWHLSYDTSDMPPLIWHLWYHISAYNLN